MGMWGILDVNRGRAVPSIPSIGDRGSSTTMNDDDVHDSTRPSVTTTRSKNKGCLCVPAKTICPVGGKNACSVRS